MIREKIKIKISLFLLNILENDSFRFGFLKNNNSNKNAFLNKLIPTLVEVRKERRNKICNILKNEYSEENALFIYDAINAVIDDVYFNDEELNQLTDYVWIRPTKINQAIFDEIELSECKITELELSVYIRNLLNEYCRLPQYKREVLVFDSELEIFADACYLQKIVYFTDKTSNVKYRAFAFTYSYGYLYDQTNYCVFYDLDNRVIKSIALHNIRDIFLIKERYHPNSNLVDKLQEYFDNKEFDKEILMEV